MNLSAMSALIQKDFVLFYKNRLFAFLSILMIVFYAIVFFLLPNTINETIEIGWVGPALPEEFLVGLEEEGLILRAHASEDELRQVVQAGDELVGVVLPPDFVLQVRSGERPQVTVYINSAVPSEFREIYGLLIREMSFFFTGQTLNLEIEEIMIGPDMAGRQISPRQRIVPMLAIFLLVTEMMGLAGLLTAELETGTIRALLVTPITIMGLFISKGIAGMLVIISQIVLVMAFTGGFRNEPLLVFVILLLGALLITGAAFLVSSVSRDMLTVIAWSIVAMFLMVIPSFNILLPGLATQWIRALPSYYLIDPIYRVISFGAGWNDVGSQLLILLAYSILIYGLGIWAVRRRLA
ncbi:MAG: ABC transporter permease [Anaerolineaceae bacterium]|jgi:ABC-2 type transport system permease protein